MTELNEPFDLRATLATMKSAKEKRVNMSIWDRDIKAVEDAITTIEALRGHHAQQTPVWLIEWPEDDNVPVRWWNPAHGWMRDANKALHFARKTDADCFLSTMRFGLHLKVTEHIFIGGDRTAHANPHAEGEPTNIEPLKMAAFLEAVYDAIGDLETDTEGNVRWSALVNIQREVGQKASEYRGECRSPAARGDQQDATRYQRLRVLGVAPAYTKHLEKGDVMRFSNLDEFVDADIKAVPNRGEASSPSQPETCALCGKPAANQVDVGVFYCDACVGLSVQPETDVDQVRAKLEYHGFAPAEGQSLAAVVDSALSKLIHEKALAEAQVEQAAEMLAEQIAKRREAEARHEP